MILRRSRFDGRPAGAGEKFIVALRSFSHLLPKVATGLSLAIERLSHYRWATHLAQQQDLRLEVAAFSPDLAQVMVR